MPRRFSITGGPGSGKTTLLAALAEAGFVCACDTARAIIRERLAAGRSPRPDLREFGWEMLRRDVEQYRSSAGGDGPVFFDRGVVDSLGYLDQQGEVSPAQVDDYVARYPYHERVFVAPPWPDIFCTDAERDQTFEESLEVHRVLQSWYARCGYETVELPRAPVADRLAFVIRQVGSAGS